MKSEVKPNILIVDDIEPNLVLLETTLRHLKACFIRACSGAEALEKIKGRELALALIDVHMPVMSGIELASQILRDKSRSLVPIIFITAYPADEKELEKIYETGVIDYISKPVNPKLLISKVKILLELYRQRNRVAESERLYRLLLNASPEGIIIMDNSGTIREISSVAAETFGITSKEDFIGSMLCALFPPEEQQRLSAVLQQAMEQGTVRNEEFSVTRSDQEKISCELSLRLIRDLEEKPAALMAVIRDITWRKKMEQQLIHTERLASIGEMATGIAHEINQPLNIISIGLENLLVEISRKQGVDADYFHNKAKLIFNNISRITYIIDHVKTFSRVNHEFTKVEFDIHESITNAVSLVESQFRNLGISITTSFDREIPRITGDPNRLEQVVLNMLLNSGDAIEEKILILKSGFNWIVDIKTMVREGKAFIEITDNGMGIKSTDLDKIMLPFHTTKKAGKGTGLGLSISYGIIREMEGDIDIESEYSRWTKVRISIPLKQKKNHEDAPGKRSNFRRNRRIE
jgi:PAS domain S-box-containing protein